VPTTEERLMQLEIKASYAEDWLDKLDAIIARQQDQIDQLHRELHRVRTSSNADNGLVGRDLRDDLPPHY